MYNIISCSNKFENLQTEVERKNAAEAERKKVNAPRSQETEIVGRRIAPGQEGRYCSVEGREGGGGEGGEKISK